MPTNERDERVIAEFRANAGVVGGEFAGARVLLLHHRGARSGEWRVTPLVWRPDGGTVVIFASVGGAPKHPAWFHNLVANPDVRIEIGTETRDVRARVAEGDEWHRLWEAVKLRHPGFGDYEVRAAPYRQIPVVVLDPR